MSHGEGVETFQVSPHGARIATTAYCNYTAMLWDMKTGQPVAEPLPSSSAIGATAFSSDSRRLVTVERITRVWDTETGQLVAESPKHDWADSVQFSPDGERVVVANQYEDTGEGKGMAKASVWDVAPSRVECPAWLLQLAEAVGGKVINKLNVTQATKLDRTEVLDRIRKELESTSDENDWVVWGRWFLADPGTRTISPFCGITVPAYIESRIKEHTAESLEEAERLASGYPELLQRISDARRTLDQAK
jgi:WD40 repeat protein